MFLNNVIKIHLDKFLTTCVSENFHENSLNSLNQILESDSYLFTSRTFLPTRVRQIRRQVVRIMWDTGEHY